MPFAVSVPVQTRHRTPPTPVRRWRFPAGTIHLVGGGFRWQRIEDEGPGSTTLLSGPLDIANGVGYLGAADLELPVTTGPGVNADDALPEFWLCHVFYDSELADRGVRGFGPWFCLCGCWGSSLRLVRAGCGRA